MKILTSLICFKFKDKGFLNSLTNSLSKFTGSAGIKNAFLFYYVLVDKIWFAITYDF